MLLVRLFLLNYVYVVNTLTFDEYNNKETKIYTYQLEEFINRQVNCILTVPTHSLLQLHCCKEVMDILQFIIFVKFYC